MRNEKDRYALFPKSRDHLAEATYGPNYAFTFNFEKAGSVSVPVPISAPESSQH